VLPVALLAQDKKALEEKQKKLESEIKYTQSLLKKTEASKNASLNDLITLEKQISLRKELIGNTEKEVNTYSEQIEVTTQRLSELEKNLALLRENYAKAIYYTYKNFRLADQLLFVASSASFSEAFRKINYLRRLGDYRKRQVDDIVKTQTEISNRLSEIQQKKKNKEGLLKAQKRQEELLTRNKNQKAKMVEQLKKKESELSKQLAMKKEEAAKLNAQIQAIIAKEIAAQSKAAKDASTPDKPNLALTPEVQKLSASFVSNKGRLPWPVERGVISKYFGSYRHPELDILMENNGIDIRTDSYSSVRSVFDGKVVGVVFNPIYKNAVIVSHGEYFTVYSKLETVNVKKGDEIKAKQIIGVVFTDNETRDSEVHFEVWKGSSKLNPTDWIAR
jgi:septal ring factor EnvC (AmiA/AmiB activator)